MADLYIRCNNVESHLLSIPSVCLFIYLSPTYQPNPTNRHTVPTIVKNLYFVRPIWLEFRVPQQRREKWRISQWPTPMTEYHRLHGLHCYIFGWIFVQGRRLQSRWWQGWWFHTRRQLQVIKQDSPQGSTRLTWRKKVCWIRFVVHRRWLWGIEKGDRKEEKKKVLSLFFSTLHPWDNSRSRYFAPQGLCKGSVT